MFVVEQGSELQEQVTKKGNNDFYQVKEDSDKGEESGADKQSESKATLNLIFADFRIGR